MNDKFLETLVDYSYSGLFGTFLTSRESERHVVRGQCHIFTARLLTSILSQDLTPDSDDGRITINDNTVSFWGWLAMVNATDQSFYNELYCPDIYNR